MSESQDYDYTTLYIGGLNRYVDDRKLKCDLKDLFECFSIKVGYRKMSVVDSNYTDYRYGFVDFQNAEDCNKVLSYLRTQKGQNYVQNYFPTIKDPYTSLKFNFRKRRAQTSAYEHCYTETTRDVPNVYVETSVQNENSNTLTSMETSVNSSPPNPPERFYRLNQQLGNETRTMEFKQGGFMRSGNPIILEETVGRYVCAFLNTNGGTLFIGVDDDGRVVGVTCNQREEDKHRRSIDHAIKDIQPLVLTSLYTADFVPVQDRNNSFSSNLKVIEVTVNTNHNEYYAYKDDFYIRRDGSVQKLSAHGRQEWITKDYSKKLEQVRGEKEKLNDKVVEFAEHTQALQKEKGQLERQLNISKQEQSKEDKDHTEQVQVLNGRIAQLEQDNSKLKKSKICSIL